MPTQNSAQTVGIALLGFGNVARAFAASARGVRIAAVADSSGVRCPGKPEELRELLAHKAAGRALRSCRSNAAAMETPDLIRRLPELGVRVVVESMPSDLKNGQPALDWLQAVLERGVSVVTVDKGPLVHGFERLVAAAEAGGASLAFRGTTGVWPASAVRGHKVVEIEGILNGTTNFVLSAMCETGIGFEEALREAQRRGIAEPNPQLDLDGWDAAAKILILSRALMKTRADISNVLRTGISPATQALVRKARSTGRVVRLLARACLGPGQVQLSVAPEILSPDSPFYPVSGTIKAAIFHTAENGGLFVSATSGLDAISEIINDDIRTVTAAAD